MKSLRQGAVIVFTLAMVVGRVAALQAEEAAAAAPVTPVAQGVSWSFEGTGSFHSADHPYFGAGDRRDNWSEGFARLRANYGRPDGLWFSAGGTVAGTASTDYYGTDQVGDGRVDQLEVGVANVGGSGVNVTAGRQDLVLGDGFLVGDGYVDRVAALWNIPFNFYDGLLVNWKGAKLHALAFGANISHSAGSEGGYPSGAIYGGELGTSVVEGSDVSLAMVQMDDSHATDLNARAYSLRATWPLGVTTLSGEAVLEGGTLAGSDLAGKGGHVKLELPMKAKWSPVVTGEYFYFSGDDPGTTDNEGYFPFQFRWSDWSRYYVGDLLASTVGTSSNMRIARAQLGATLREGTGMRLMAHRFDRARDDSGTGTMKMPFAYEYDLVVDQALGDHWSAWVMGGFATPLDDAKASWGSANSGQVFASVSWKFGTPGGDEE